MQEQKYQAVMAGLADGRAVDRLPRGRCRCQLRDSFRADNPGLWMDHCHNLPNAAEGQVAQLMYTGIESFFRVGGESGNEPK